MPTSDRDSLRSVLQASAQASVGFALSCLEPARTGLRARSSFVDPEGRVMHWHDFGDLEGPGWAANAIGGAHLLTRWGVWAGDDRTQRAALGLVDHILGDGFVRPDGFIWPYWDLARESFCLNYAHRNDWLCPGSLAKVGVQMLDLAATLGAGERAERLRSTAQGLSNWLCQHVPLWANGWAPRRITLQGDAYPLTPEGAPDPIFDHSADGLFLLELWALLGEDAAALRLGDAFVQAGGHWGSINHDTYDDHENVAYAVAFRALRRAGALLGRPEWSDFAYRSALPAMARFRMREDTHGVATCGLAWMEESWDTAYLWENAEVAQAHLEAWLERGDTEWRDVALETLLAIAKHHHGPLGFLTEGVDWNNHVSQRHHVDRAYYGAIRFTEPLLNNLHLVGATLTVLESGALGALQDADVPLPHASLAPAAAGLGAAHAAGARYLLRLPYPLLASDESVAAVLDFVRQARVDGVMLFESDFDTDPALLELSVLERRFARLRELVPRFRQADLEVHIDVMITLGHVDGGGGHPERFPFQFQVDEQGRLSRCSACPLDPAFLDYAAQIYRWAAGCGADAIWVDDDVRFLWHDQPGVTCFCPLHLAQIAERLGPDAPGSRAELAATLRDDARGAPARVAWFALQEEAITALAGRIEREVHALAPHTAIGLMTVGTSVHHAEGRHTDRLLRILAGPGQRPLLRPGSGFWCDWEPNRLLAKTEEVSRQASFLGRDVRQVAEIENYPYTPYQKSQRIMALEMALEVLAGQLELGLSLAPATGALRFDEVDYVSFLRRLRPFLDALASARVDKVRLGIGVEAGEELPRRMRLRGRPLMAWVESRPWEPTLAMLGLPIGAPTAAPHFLAGDVPAAMDRYALGSAFQDGVVLTPRALAELLAQGCGPRLGITAVRPAPPGVTEVFSDDPLNGTHAGVKLPVRHYAPQLNPHTVELAAGATARVLSHWVDVDGVDRGPAGLALELADGSRLGLAPFEPEQPCFALLFPARRAVWAALFEWVAREPLPCRVLSGPHLAPQLLVSLQRDEALLAVANLSADAQPLKVALAEWVRPAAANRLTDEGAWVDAPAGPAGDIAPWSLAVWRWALR